MFLYLSKEEKKAIKALVICQKCYLLTFKELSPERQERIKVYNKIIKKIERSEQNENSSKKFGKD